MNTLIFILKFLGSILFFMIFKYFLYFVIPIGDRYFIDDYYWVLVTLSLVPAFIAKHKGYSFFLFWIISIWTPIISTIWALGLDNQDPPE